MEMENEKILDLTKHSKEEVEDYLDKLRKEKKVVVTSGYFDPIHHGHIELFQKSRELGDHLIVLLNNDTQTKLKKGFVFMPHEERAKIISELRSVDQVFISIDNEDVTSVKSLDFLKPHIFAKGGDRKKDGTEKFINDIPEGPVCIKHGIQLIDGVGAKVQSSSDLIAAAEEAKKRLGIS